jgi:transcription-repair coupling factor (superfamily II helicase)
MLGGEQSGHIEAVGFDMYMEMLETAIAELKGEKAAPEIEPEIDLNINVIIPDDYIEDPDLRLSIYRKIASAKDVTPLHKIIDELKDRFGPPPEKAERLVEVMELKLMAKKLFINKIQKTGDSYKLLFAPDTPVSSDKIFSLYNTRKRYLKFLPEGGIELKLKRKEWRDVFSELKGVMEELGSEDESQPA